MKSSLLQNLKGEKAQAPQSPILYLEPSRARAERKSIRLGRTRKYVLHSWLECVTDVFEQPYEVFAAIEKKDLIYLMEVRDRAFHVSIGWVPYQSHY
jgi:hypothetical protein